MTTLTPRMMKSAMIQKASKSSHTVPEKAFNAYQESRGMNLYWSKEGESYVFTDRLGEIYDFQLDFIKLKNAWDDIIDIDFEIDGSKYHSSDRQMRKDAWKDDIKALRGVKVIHIPAAITAKRFWPYLDAEIKKALESKEMVIHIDG